MRRQALLKQTSAGLEAFVALLRAHASLTRVLSAQLVAEHGLTINDYEALLRLARADGGRMRRVDLAGELLLTASGVTRLLEGLEAAELVERAACPDDRRVHWAVLTDAGRARLEAASRSHVAAIEDLLGSRLSGEELVRLGELLRRAAGGEDAHGAECAA